MPHLIWVRALVFQSAPAVAIRLAGQACGMPYAPLDGLVAFHRQPLSPFQSRTRQLNSLVVFQPYAGISDLAMA